MTTAGEGGMVTTNNEEYWRLCWELKDHGKSWAHVNEPHNGGGFRWLHDSFGSNYRMTEMQSAIGRLQPLKMDEWQPSSSTTPPNCHKRCRSFTASDQQLSPRT